MDPERGRLFIRHLHAFRGFAIINIVAVHAFGISIYDVAGGPSTSDGMEILDALNETIFHDSTLYFALISGLLFSLVLKDRGWPAFFKSKLLNVISPYVLISLLFTWYHWPLGGGQSRVIFSGSIGEFASAAFENIYTGGAMFHLWYIPVLAMLFIATPLVSALLIRANTRWIIWPILIAPLFFSRTWPEFSWGNPVYFMGAYAAGMAIGMNYEGIANALQKNTRWLWLIVAVTSPVLIYMFLTDFEYLGPVSVRESVFYVQKMCFAFLALVWLKNHEARLPNWLDVLATYAFSIYFLHVVFLPEIMEPTKNMMTSAPGVAGTIGLGFVYLAMVLVICVLISAALKKLIGRRSRMVIGA